jgi:hypothetical protein
MPINLSAFVFSYGAAQFSPIIHAPLFLGTAAGSQLPPPVAMPAPSPAPAFDVAMAAPMDTIFLLESHMLIG